MCARSTAQPDDFAQTAFNHLPTSSTPSKPANMSTTVIADATTRRKSGRVVHKPDIYQPDSGPPAAPNGNAKRKRDAPPLAAPQDDPEDEEEDEEEEEEEEEGEDSGPDDEEERDQRRKARSRGGKKRAPANKKPKTSKSSEGISLAMRPATNGVKRSSKPKAPRRPRKSGNAGADGTGLYGTCGFGNVYFCVCSD